MLPLVLLPALLSLSNALEVTNTSTCTSTCNGPSLTYSSDLQCEDSDYSNTANGVLFKNCLECESTSTAFSGDSSTPQNNDLYWMLFNMKYTLQYCLFQSNGSTPNLPQCEEKCAGLYAPLSTSWFDKDDLQQQYDYCSINGSAFTSSSKECASCLQGGEGSVVLGNFLDTMQAGCDSQPDSTQDQLLAMPVELFATSTTATTTSSTASSDSTPTGSAAATDSAATDSPATTTSSSTSSSTASLDAANTASPPIVAKSSAGLSTGAAAGIGAGIAVLAIAAAAGLAWFCLRRRKQQRQQIPDQAQAPAHTSYYKDAKHASISAASVSPLPAYTATQQQQQSYTAEMPTAREYHEMGMNERNFASELDSRPVR